MLLYSSFGSTSRKAHPRSQCANAARSKFRRLGSCSGRQRIGNCSRRRGAATWTTSCRSGDCASSCVRESWCRSLRNMIRPTRTSTFAAREGSRCIRFANHLGRWSLDIQGHADIAKRIPMARRVCSSLGEKPPASPASLSSCKPAMNGAPSKLMRPSLANRATSTSSGRSVRLVVRTNPANTASQRSPSFPNRYCSRSRPV